ncbi:MAG TPA: helix-turn-helix transcriptional regulator [Gaiellales bacterium]|jgi:transcriptional regulator with XRE-family HTH domain|nr:helix-turn-helix transcriptional regulator [Gaiellales bacterium]
MAKTAAAGKSVPFDPGLGQLMSEAGVSYRRLAEMTDLSAGYLNHLAHGNRPVPADAVIERIAKALGVPPDRFLEYRIRRIGDVLRGDPRQADRVYGRLCS